MSLAQARHSGRRRERKAGPARSPTDRNAEGRCEGPVHRHTGGDLGGSVPGLDANAMFELTRHDTTDRAKATPLQLATNAFFPGAGSSHIHTVVCRSPGTLRPTALVGVQEQGPRTLS